ncbi:MAG: diguanylate cyclase [Hylemonella sp.]|uniref:diguanylate cyclase domain-containing protein n=1 Tax=Hylemonella sp. TaxID=2066020 RepID=UPI0022CADDF8|nr:diguanylate cyclase [Hylemonella sp.]MCZ8251141.1 diguanylate cyclase [Hylemonella sp.]
MRFPSSTFLSRHAVALGSALVVFLLLQLAGEVLLRSLLQDRVSKRQLETLSYATTLRVRLERELNALLNLNSGMVAYLTVRNNSMETREVQAILAELHRSSQHVRNFAVAVGYRLLYVHPVEGNERAIGLYYPDIPAQWVVIQRIAQSGESALAGPVQLVQGGRGLIYRKPIMIEGRYWGLLSTVIDSDSLFRMVQAEAADGDYEFAIRGSDGRGHEGGAVWGPLSLFEQPDALLQQMEVPGGQWVIAVRPVRVDDTLPLRAGLRTGVALAGLVVALMLFLLIRNRGLMAQRAMYDDLTHLPNRRLFEDRALMAFSRQQRQPGQLCALLFLDLDDFKSVNDRHGHKAGDAVLVAVAARAQAAVRQNDTVARWGGDEFIVLLENISADMLETIAQRLRRSIQEPVDYQGNLLQVGVSIGLALYPDAGQDLDQLLHAADHHMYSDKTDRKGASRPAPLAK